MPSQYMPYRKGDLLKAADVNLLLASAKFFTNNGYMGIGTDSVFVIPTEHSVWLNVTESIESNKLNRDDIRPYGVLYGIPKPSKKSSNTESDEQADGQPSFGRWVFYSTRKRDPHCQAFYTITGPMSPTAIHSVSQIKEEDLQQSEETDSQNSQNSQNNSGSGGELFDEGSDDSGGDNSSDNSGGGGDGYTSLTTSLADLQQDYFDGHELDKIKGFTYKRSADLSDLGMPNTESSAGDTMENQVFVLAVPMVPGERYLLDVDNNFDDDPTDPGKEYVLDPKTNKLKKASDDKDIKSDFVVHRRRYHPKTDAYSAGMDPRFALGDDNLIWCGGEGYYSGKVGNPLDPPPGFEIGPVYRIEYGGSVYIGKFSLTTFHFWNIETGYIVPGWVDKTTGASVFHPSASASSSGELFSPAKREIPLMDDGPSETGTSDSGGLDYVDLGTSFAAHSENGQGSCLAEVIYNPMSTASETVVESESNLGTVRLPISSVLIPKLDVPPRMDAPLDLEGRTLYDTYDSDSSSGDDNEHLSTVSFPDFSDTEAGSKAVAYSYLVAKSLGLVEPADSTPTYQAAYYSAEDTIRPFCKRVSIDKSNGSLTGKLKDAAVQSGWTNIEIKESVLIKEGEENEDDEYLCFGTYEPEELRTSERIYFDILSSSKTLYVQRIEADYIKNEAYARHVPLLKNSSDTDTCGWVRYRYYDELESNQKAERVKLSVPALLGSDVTVSDNSWEVNGNEIDPIMFTPFASAYGMGYGYAETESINESTLEATILYYPYRSSGREEQQDGQDGDTLDGSAPRYDQYHSFPFFFSGLPQPKRARLTTKEYKAHRSDWVPAICTTLDHNEVLIPGMVVSIEDKTTTVNDQTFRYLGVTPPESYSTVLEGTPKNTIYKITYRAPSPTDLEAETIKEDDCWITGIKKLDDDESPSLNPPSGTIYRIGVELNSETGVPVITEPFGAFNNCDNRGSLTVFLRTTAWGVNYTCTARLDHIPFGYAVPSKTPSCYYKSGNDPCAAHMVGQRYLVKRIEADNRLYLTGACYVPCSTLSSFN